MKKGFLVPAMLCASFNCQAYDYFYRPFMNSNERYSSNIYLATKPDQGNWITTLSPGIDWGVRNDNFKVNSNFTWNQLFYTNQSALDISEQLFSVDYSHTHDRFQWGMDSSYNNQSSLSSSPSNQGTVLGYSLTQVMAKQLSLAPTVTYALTELSSVTLNYSYNKTDYEKTTNNYLRNYEYQQLAGSYTHLYTEKDKLDASLSGSIYDSPSQSILGYGLTTYNTVAQTGWQHSFSEQLVSYLSVGINYSQSDLKLQEPQLQFIGFNFQGKPVYFDPVNGPTLTQQYLGVNQSTTGMGSVYRASLQKSFESGSVSVVGSQNQTPTSQGLQTQTQLSVTSSYRLTERLSTGLSASYAMYEQTGAQSSFLNRTYSTISPNLNWQWTREVNVGLSYSYVQQDYDKSNQSAQNNTLQLQLSYQPQLNNQVK